MRRKEPSSVTPGLNPNVRATWAEKLRHKSSAPLLNDQLAEEWRQGHSTSYKVGLGIASLLTKALDWFRTMVSKNRSTRRIPHPGLTLGISVVNQKCSHPPSPQPGLLNYVGSLTPWEYAHTKCEEPKPGLLGRSQDTVLGMKFELLRDACWFQQNMNAPNQTHLIFWSQDPEMPYEVIFTEKFLYLSFPRGTTIN